MSAIFKAIHEFDKRIEARAEHFAFKHPYLSFLLYLSVCRFVFSSPYFFHRNYYGSDCFDFRMAVSVLI